jgi:hypothetical protein
LIRALVDQAYTWLAWSLPRALVWKCGMRILSEVTTRPELSKVGRELHQGEVRLLYALDRFINARQ